MNPVVTFIDQLTDQMEQRHAWLQGAGERVEAWKAEDAANGEPWGDDPDGLVQVERISPTQVIA